MAWFGKTELVDIIEWLDETNDTMVFRFERHDNEIKNGAKLIVREGQVALFVKEGQLADVFQPGSYTLETKNIPILSTLAGWKYGFDSPFKAEVYFVSTTQFTDMGWGTPAPVMLRDQDFGAVQIRAFGNYSFKITDPSLFLKEIVGTDGDFSTDEIEDQLRTIIVSKTVDSIAESKIPVLDLAAQYDEIAEIVVGKCKGDFQQSYGLEITQFIVENINLPEELQEALNKRATMNILGDMNTYSQYQAANAMETAAEKGGDSSSAMSTGMEMAMGIGMMNQMNNTMNAQQAQRQPVQQPPQGNMATPPPPPMPVLFHVMLNGNQAGPYDMSTLQQYVTSGHLTRDSLVWKNGMPNWLAAKQVPELLNLFAATPPPPPPM
jgi:membrane protease subunit (stomatin/prohibitin family)